MGLACPLYYVNINGDRTGESQMKWFFRWLTNKLNETAYVDYPVPATNAVMIKESTNRPSSNGTNINVWSATGGYIVEFRKYTEYKENTSNMYIISADQNFSESLTKIITLEMLR
jgi:hypothetical protein